MNLLKKHLSNDHRVQLWYTKVEVVKFVSIIENAS